MSHPKKHLLFYIIGNGINLALKVAFTNLWLSFGIMIGPSYVITHFIILLTGYFYHVRVTFGRGTSWESFRKYFAATFVVKFMDYVIVVAAVYFAVMRATFAIILAAGSIYVIRYLLIRWALSGKGEEDREYIF